MCAIIDATVFGKFLKEPPGQDAAPIYDWLERKGGKIVYSTGGKFRSEVIGRARERLRVLSQSGMAVAILEDRFIEEEKSLEGQIKSDDPHIVALARASGARLLFTDDQNLMEDFKNKKFIDNPRGKIYSKASNSNLLTKSTCTNVRI